MVGESPLLESNNDQAGALRVGYGCNDLSRCAELKTNFGTAVALHIRWKEALKLMFEIIFNGSKLHVRRCGLPGYDMKKRKFCVEAFRKCCRILRSA